MATKEGAKRVRFNNPEVPLSLPGSRRKKNMATTKRKTNKSRRRSNSATKPAATRSAAPKRNHATPKRRTASTAPKTNPRSRKRRSSRRRKNPTGLARIFNPRLPKLPGGLTLTSLAAAGGGALAAQLLNNAITFGAVGSWIEIVKQFGIVALVATVWPAKLDKKSATAGAAAVPVVTLVNRVAPNAVARLASFIPHFGIPAAAGTAGLVDANHLALGGHGRAYGMGGLVNYNPAERMVY
jgi:hypothetical protein